MLLTATLLTLPARTGTVDFAPPVIRRIAIDQKIRRCATTDVIDACTAFAEETLTCHCGRTRGEWRLSAIAHSAPMVYLLSDDRRIVDHELRHIEDIRSGLETEIAALTSLRFASRSECLRASREASEAFPQRMNALRAQSQARYR